MRRPGVTWAGSAVLPILIVVAIPGLSWWLVRGRDWEPQWVLAAVGLAITASAAIAALVERAFDRRRARVEAPPNPRDLPSEVLERWRVSLRREVARQRTGDGGQLGKMVRQGDLFEVAAVRIDRDRDAPQARVGRLTRPWPEVTRCWDGARRLVILGDAGSGKTVAALTLIKHINASDAPGARVAELFPLAEWHRWRGDHPEATFRDWLSRQLAVMHPDVPASVARELIDAQLVVPVLDGLDEIESREQRCACVAALDAYAERGAPHRSFVLLCRTRAYRELAPEFARADEVVELVGLAPTEIMRALDDRTAALPLWDRLRTRQAAGERGVNDLLSSPLRLAVALQVYRDRDPSELLELSDEQARSRLWELLLTSNAGTYPGATEGQVRAWLAWLAGGMRRTKRQGFRLHEVEDLDAEDGKKSSAAIVFGLVGGLSLGVFFGVLQGLASAWDTALLSALVGAMLGSVLGLVAAEGGPPSAPAERAWRVRARRAMAPDRLRPLRWMLAFPLVVGLVAGLGGPTAGLTAGLTATIALALIGVLALPFVGIVETDPPERFRHEGPQALLIASRRAGLTAGLACGLTIVLLCVGLGLGEGVPAEGIVAGLLVGVPVAAFGAVTHGVGSCAYHRWLRWRLHARGVLPARVPDFLEWCAADERGWVRITGVYEFRHSEMLDYLANDNAG